MSGRVLVPAILYVVGPFHPSAQVPSSIHAQANRVLRRQQTKNYLGQTHQLT